MDIETKLQKLAESTDSVEKIEIIESIIESNEINEAVISAMTEFLNNEDSGLKDSCARALSELKEPQSSIAAKYIAPLILDSNIELKNLAGDILIRLGSSSASYLRHYLVNPDPDVKKFACDILGLLGTRHLSNDIHPLLDDDDENVVQSAIEALGNYQDTSAIDKLIQIYSRDSDQKAIIIEALGKIGSQNAMNYLLDFLKNEKDDFLKTTIIDSLSLNCEEMEIAQKLFDSIEDVSPSIQLIILKTVSAIAFRLGENIVLPDHLRHISYKALFDDDPDIRAAGLLALGKVYQPDDFPSVFNEIFKNNPDTQSLVLERLLFFNEPEMIHKFLRAFCSEVATRSSVSCDIDFLSILSYMWNDVSEVNKTATIKVMIDSLFDYAETDVDTTFELLMKLDNEKTPLLIRERYLKASEEEKSRFEELSLKYDLVLA